MATQFNSSGNVPTFPAHRGNAITKEYYHHLVGKINAGTVKAAVLRVEDTRFFNSVRYYLISIR